MWTVMKERMWFLVKYVVGLSLLGWVFYRYDFSRVVMVPAHIGWTPLFLVLAISLMVLLLQFLRWRYLVQAYSQQSDLRTLLAAFFAGFAFRLMIPGGHAEISKILLLPGPKGSKAVAFGVEKYFEAYIKALMLLFFLPVAFGLPRWGFWGPAFAGMVFLLLWPLILKHRWIRRFQEKEVDYVPLLLYSLVISLLVLLGMFAQYDIMLRSMSNVSHKVVWLTVVLVWTSGLLPISISGMGVRENVAAFYLARYGVEQSLAAGVAFFVFLVNVLIPSAVGFLIIFLKRQRLKHEGKVFKKRLQNLIKSR